MSVRALLDTSVLVPARTREALVDAVRHGAYTALWSPWVVAELNRVLTWFWIERTRGDLSVANQRACLRAANAMMVRLLESFELVDVERPEAAPPAWLRDRFDHPVWAAARAGKAAVVVSDNRRDFPPADAAGRHRWLDVEYLTAAEFLKTLATST